MEHDIYILLQTTLTKVEENQKALAYIVNELDAAKGKGKKTNKKDKAVDEEETEDDE